MGLFSKLQNGDTQLKSLKFGKDRPNGGDSGQPYIQDPIDKVNSPTNTDFLLRGGKNAPLNAVDDVTRLTKYFFNSKSPSGLLFTAKQNLLSRTSVRTEASKGLLNNGIYTPLKTLAQVGSGFLGIHFEKQGIIGGLRNYEDVVKKNNEPGVNNIPAEKTTTVLIPNPLGGVTSNLGTTPSFLPTEQTTIEGGFSNRLLNIWYNKQFKFSNSNDVDVYGGGPGSILGIGKTRIKFTDQRTGENNLLSKSDSKRFYKGGIHRVSLPIDYNNMLGASIKQGLSKFETGINDSGSFNTLYNPTKLYSTLSKNNPQKLQLTGSGGYQIGNNLKYQTQESDSTYVSKIGKKLQTVSSYPNQIRTTFFNHENRSVDTSGKPLPTKYDSTPTLIDGGYLDSSSKQDPTLKIRPDFRETPRKKRGFDNKTGSYDHITETLDTYNDKTLDKIYYNSNYEKRTSLPFDTSNDLIEFYFTVINPANVSPRSTQVKFKAYIDSFSDSYSAGWKDQTYMGRAEKFHKYSSFERDISLSFTVVADNANNLETMYKSLSFLASSIAPTYTSQGYMAGNLHKLTVGNYIKNQVGIMSGFSFDVDNETPWEITEDKQLPYYIKVSGIKFTPIHHYRPETTWSDSLELPQSENFIYQIKNV